MYDNKYIQWMKLLNDINIHKKLGICILKSFSIEYFLPKITFRQLLSNKEFKPKRSTSILRWKFIVVIKIDFLFQLKKIILVTVFIYMNVLDLAPMASDQ